MNRHREHYHRRNLIILDWMTLWLSASFALWLYFQSAYMEGLFGVEWVGPIFMVSSLVSLVVVFPAVEWSLRWPRSAVAGWLMVIVLALVGMAWQWSPLVSLALFIFYVVALFVVQVLIDVIMEMFSRDEDTGTIRSLKLTLYNLPLAIAPLVGGLIITWQDYRLLLLLAAVLMLPIFFLIDALAILPKQIPRRIPDARHSLRQLFHDPDVARITFMAFLLQTFYGVMVLYVPLYLLWNQYTLGQIGLLTFFILLPFIIFQLPAGIIADRYLGEKELMALGAFLIGIGTMLFALVPPQSVWLVAASLFLSRIGASLLEAMRDSAFYKHIEARDVPLITMLWSLQPAGFLVAATVGSMLVFYGTYTELFFVTGLLFLFSLPAVATLHDTK